MMKYQSAKVYVIDFHFEADSKESIANKKDELDKYFDELRRKLEETHRDVVQQVFLRKH